MSFDSQDALNGMLRPARHLVAFTGSGISAESGIPTYRGEDGVWHRYDPARYADIHYFLQDPRYYYNFFRDVRYPGLKKAEPNAAHRALAALEERGSLRAVITQNIDGLHQLAGSRRVLELHGNSRHFSCLGCRKRLTMDAVFEQLSSRVPPACPACGGLPRPEVVFFGEALPAGAFDEAAAEARQSDVFLVVGSALVVQPAASLPAEAKRHGARLVIINKEPTPLDPMADLVIHQGASEVLKGVL
jgi:NAD-dependent deacetylase